MKVKEKKTKKQTKKLVDVVPVVEMTREELEAHLGRVREELEREREDRNYCQLERDKVMTFWEISKHQLMEKTAELRAKQQELEELAERRERELAAYRQKAKYLEAAHASEIAELKAEMVKAVNLAAEEASANAQSSRLVDEALRNEQCAHENLIRKIQMDNEKGMHELRRDFERQSDEERRVHEEKMQQLYERMDLQRRTELQTTEERKNKQISVLIQNHEKAFMEIKNYYHDVTVNNVNLINDLKKAIEELQKKESHINKENVELIAKNKNLDADLSKSQRECTELRRKMENYSRDVKALKNAKTEVKQLRKNLSDAKLDNEVLLQRLQHAENERDELYERFVVAVQEVKQKCGLKNAILEHRITRLGEKLDVQGQFTPRLGEDGAPTDEAKRTFEAYNDLVSVFKGQLESFGIRMENVGFQVAKDILINGGKASLGKGPASLITVPPT
ncbi:unnamed protein product [Mesocestoides corti]|uniref:Dynein regulatory complex subunit 4 n=1 Tax=Mesocestoides corti TaxID=53468 RepID=A0A0R3U3Y8_MESCO|nr:unnamed protein product [Mesocestoides corti]